MTAHDNEFFVASALGHARPTGLLQGRLPALAGTPDGDLRIETDLIVVAQLAAKLITGVDCASVTSRHEGGYVTVAASSDVAVAVDQAQYDDKAGPCLEALEGDYPAAVPDIAATMTWPGFRDNAARWGLRTSLSIPLFAGSGTTTAALNLYSRATGALSTLTTAVWAAYEPDFSDRRDPDALDAGGRELTAGLIGAVALRAMIQRAVAVLSAGEADTDGGYPARCRRIGVWPPASDGRDRRRRIRPRGAGAPWSSRHRGCRNVGSRRPPRSAAAPAVRGAVHPLAGTSWSTRSGSSGRCRRRC